MNSQEKCANTLDNNLQIVACAGAGKTKTVVDRIVNILRSQKAVPAEIVAITFTEKAAGELKQRIYQEVEFHIGSVESLADMYVGTIHGYCLELLKISNTEYRKFEVLNDIQSKLFIKRHYWDPANKALFEKIKYFKADGSVGSKLYTTNWTDVSSVLNTVNFIREELIDQSKIPKDLNNFFIHYSALLNKRHLFDYAQIQYAFYHELKTNALLQSYIRDNLKFITIDEYQDVNTIQEAILKEIHKFSPSTNICVVGDDDQTIYQWRGSNVNNFGEFPNNYSNSVVEHLGMNYRSSEGIVKTAEHVVVDNKIRSSKILDSYKKVPYEKGDIIANKNFKNITDETDFIIESIEKLKDTEIVLSNGEKKVLGYDDMAILVHSPSKLIEFNQELFDNLEQRNIPYIIEGTKKLFESNEIIDFINLFIYFNNNYIQSQFTFEYLNELPSSTSLENLFTLFQLNSVQIKQLYENFEDIQTKYFNKKDSFFGDYTVQEFFRDICNILDVFNFFDNLSMNMSSSEAEKIIYNLASFSTLINDHETIYFNRKIDNRFRDFIYFILNDAQALYPEGWLSPNFKSVKCLKIMSIHKSKGLEFPVVFMPNLCTNYMFPVAGGGGRNTWGFFKKGSMNNLKNRYTEKKESLNRLMYVGITRSEKYLFLTKALQYSKPTGVRVYDKTPRPLANALHSAYINFNPDDFLNRVLTKNHVNIDNDLQQLVFDFTTLKDYFECPHRFQLNSLFGFTSPLNVRMGYGRSIHNMLEDVHSSYFNNKVLKDSPEDIEQLLKMYLDLPYGNHLEELMNATKKSARISLKRYIDQNKVRFKDIELIEQKIDFKLNDLIFINGRVDLVRNTKSGEITIVDFKSNNQVLSSELVKKQLLIYALGYKKLTGISPTSIESYDVKNADPDPMPITEKDIIDIESEINQVYNTIRTNSYKKNYDKDSNKCKNCEYVNSCKKEAMD